jgi:acyl-CoA synthetase (AMP-forming)/AMP-acid ligase II
MNFARNLERSAFFFPGRPAVCEESSEISYAELNEKANLIATALIRYPKEVEEVLFAREEVQECAVIGLPDREWGGRVAAFIIQRPGKNFNKEELHAYLKSRLSSFKVPKEYRLVNDFPKSPAGKILKRELRKRVEPAK